MKRYITTAVAAINLDGIRVVQKSTMAYDHGFSISITYKGNHFSISYPTREDRDRVFDEICTELEKRNK